MLKYARICCANSLEKKGVPTNFLRFLHLWSPAIATSLSGSILLLILSPLSNDIYLILSLSIFCHFCPFFSGVVKVKDFLWLLRVQQQSIIAFFHFFPRHLPAGGAWLWGILLCSIGVFYICCENPIFGQLTSTSKSTLDLFDLIGG